MDNSSLNIYSGATLNLMVGSFDCGRKLMNRDFYQTPGGDQSPYIQIVLLETRLVGAPTNDRADIVAELQITINGIEKTIEVLVIVSQSAAHSFIRPVNRSLKPFGEFKKGFFHRGDLGCQVGIGARKGIAVIHIAFVRTVQGIDNAIRAA